MPVNCTFLMLKMWQPRVHFSRGVPCCRTFVTQAMHAPLRQLKGRKVSSVKAMHNSPRNLFFAGYRKTALLSLQPWLLGGASRAVAPGGKLMGWQQRKMPGCLETRELPLALQCTSGPALWGRWPALILGHRTQLLRLLVSLACQSSRRRHRQWC